MVKFSINLLSLVAAASLVKSAQIYSCTESNTIALTFDDGPTKYTNSLIEKLNKHDIKATFFINAHNHYPYADESKEIQNVLKKAYQSGHQIASHTYEHNLYTEYSEMKKSFEKMDSWVKSVIGVTPRYFRAPGGECDSTCEKNIESLGYRIIKWDVDTNDWKLDANGSISILKEEFNKGKKNYLVLMHDSKEHSIEETVPWIIESGISKKYKFVTVAECLGEKSKMYKDGSSPSSTKTNTVTTTVTTTVTIAATATGTTTIPGNLSSTTNAVATGYVESSLVANTSAVDESESGSLTQYNRNLSSILIISLIMAIARFL